VKRTDEDDDDGIELADAFDVSGFDAEEKTPVKE
jgi:hypothetical protein